MPELYLPSSTLAAELAFRKQFQNARLFEALDRYSEEPLREILRARFAGRAANHDLADALRRQPGWNRERAAHFQLFGQHGPDDNRHDVTSYADATVRALAESIAIIAPRRFLTKRGDLWHSNVQQPCTDVTRICDWVKFADQPRLNCDPRDMHCWTGALIHPQALLTCGHGHPSVLREQHSAIFGFQTSDSDFFVPEFASHDVVDITQIISLRFPIETTGADFAIFWLERPVRRPWLEIVDPEPDWWRHAPKVHTIGHPSSLPMKIADDACAAPHPTYSDLFLASLDTYSGSSGSPVFAQREDGKHCVVGVVSRGQIDEHDYGWCDTSLCNYPYRYTYLNPYYVGQWCVRSSAFALAVEYLHRYAR